MKQLAINNDYFVCVFKEMGNVIKVVYPENKDLKLKENIYTYYHYENELFCILDKKQKSTKFFNYELRPFITSHILLMSISRNIPPEYIKVYDEYNNPTKLAYIMPKPKLLKQESKLTEKLLTFINTRKATEVDMKRNIQRFIKFYEDKYD